MKNKQPKRTYYVRYTVTARNVLDALKIAKTSQPDDVYTHADEEVSTHAIGFHAEELREEEEE